MVLCLIVVRRAFFVFKHWLKMAEASRSLQRRVAMPPTSLQRRIGRRDPFQSNVKGTQGNSLACSQADSVRRSSGYQNL